MSDVVQSLPSEDSEDGKFARQLARLIGPAIQPADGTNIAQDMLALGGALADARATLRDLLAEAFADSAWDLLSELERVYGLPVREDLSRSQRQTRLVAKVRAARAGTPDSILLAVAPYDTTASIYENVAADVTYYPSAVFLWDLIVSAAVHADAEAIIAIRAIVEQMKPAHTKCFVVTKVGFKFGDSGSLMGRDAWGP